eukprot:scaffold4475_cov114-Isochrysis_galbana.AAC.8
MGGQAGGRGAAERRVAGTGWAAADERQGRTLTLGMRNLTVCGILPLMEVMWIGDAPTGSPSKRMRKAYLPCGGQECEEERV